jgi:glycosyltransferase involved in cell wall biosynthesis
MISIELTSPIQKSDISQIPPAVSWLLCVHVLNEQLRFAIQSCLDQTFTDFELLVVANGSKAEAIAVAVQSWFGHDPRLRVITTDVRFLTFSLTLGLHHARAPLIARMDSDDLSKPDRLEHQVAFMQSHPNVVVLGSAYELIDADGQPQRTVHLPTENRAIRKAMLWGNPLCHPSVMLRRSVVIAAGGYLGGIHAEDYDLWARLVLNTEHHFANLKESYVGYRVIGVGVARGSRISYASIAASQFRNFVQGAGFIWAVSAGISMCKGFIKSKSVRNGYL